MRKRDLVDGVVGPRLEETLDQIFCMKGMTTAEKVAFLMSRNRELRAENHHMQAENADLRELVRNMWRFTGTACKKYPRLFDQSAQGGQMVMPNMLDSFEQRMAELGIEVES